MTPLEHVKQMREITYAYVSSLKSDEYYQIILRDITMLKTHLYKFYIVDSFSSSSDTNSLYLNAKEQRALLSTNVDSIILYFNLSSEDLYNPNTAYKTPLLKYIPDNTLMYKEIVLAAYTNHKSALKYTSSVLLDDFDFAIKLLDCYCGHAFPFLSDRLQKDSKIIKYTIEADPGMIIYVQSDVEDYNAYVITALEQDGTILEILSTSLQSNIDIVKIAVKENINALQYASLELKQDSEIIALTTDVSNKKQKVI